MNDLSLKAWIFYFNLTPTMCWRKNINSRDKQRAIVFRQHVWVHIMYVNSLALSKLDLVLINLSESNDGVVICEKISAWQN